MTVTETPVTPVCLLDLQIPEWDVQFKTLGMPAFVARQVRDWVFGQNVTVFSNMSNISKANREKLADHFTVMPYRKIEILPSKDKLATKLIFELSDGAKVEAVILKEPTYTNLCVSSQAGCPVDCKFCVTGIGGYKRNLTVAEIVGQVIAANQVGQIISHLVFMGMGEPLLNYDRLFLALDTIHSSDGLGISKRKVTVSTSGYLASIQRLITDERWINLAFSVGSPIPEKRLAIMPIEERNPIKEVVATLRKFLSHHNRKLTLEYTIMEGINDSDEDAKGLAQIAKTLKAKVNVINLNPHHWIPFNPVSTAVLHRFVGRLRHFGAPVTVRFRKGQDIGAACGQLGGDIPLARPVARRLAAVAVAIGIALASGQVSAEPISSTDILVKRRVVEHTMIETYTGNGDGVASVMGYQFDYFLDDTTSLGLAIFGAVAGNRGGYGIAAVGVGRMFKLSPSTRIMTKAYVGSGGGGGVSAGGGFLWEVMAVLSQTLMPRIDLEVGVGYLTFPTGSFSTPVVNIGVAFHSYRIEAETY